MHALEEQGLIRKEKGRGAFVNRTSSGSWLLQWAGALFDDELSRRGVTVESTVLRACVERLPDWAADTLQLGRGAQGVTLERLRRVDGELALYVVNHLPEEYAAILPEIRKKSTASLYWTLRDKCGVEVAGSSRMLEAVAALGLARSPAGGAAPVSPCVHPVCHQGRGREARRLLTERGCAPTGCGSPWRPTRGRRWPDVS